MGNRRDLMWGQERIKCRAVWSVMFVIHSVILQGKQQIWKLRLGEFKQLAQDPPAVKCKLNPCLFDSVHCTMCWKQTWINGWVNLRRIWNCLLSSSCVYLFTAVFPELSTEPTSQEELNKYLLLSEWINKWRKGQRNESRNE